jgi:hypothetical protein
VADKKANKNKVPTEEEDLRKGNFLQPDLWQEAHYSESLPPFLQYSLNQG